MTAAFATSHEMTQFIAIDIGYRRQLYLFPVDGARAVYVKDLPVAHYQG